MHSFRHRVGQWREETVAGRTVLMRSHALDFWTRELPGDLLHVIIDAVNLDNFLDVESGFLHCDHVQLAKGTRTLDIDGANVEAIAATAAQTWEWQVSLVFTELSGQRWTEILEPTADPDRFKRRAHPVFNRVPMAPLFGRCIADR